ncbi:MAG: twin-arginine translocation signal domain-containing protein [Myxococcales bacterium]|nr:twin-arginine translocation signal domain-containing protein [Myxococcales bacterium]
MPTRRDFLEQIAAVTGAVVLAPHTIGCSSEPTTPPEPTSGAETPEADPLAVPLERPAGWDAIAYNRTRGNAGAIPESYLPSINGPDGDTNHLGKHLPFVPALSPASVPTGMLAIMWGDPSKGHTPHPNAPPTEENPEGHWYDWIRIRKATHDEAAEAESRFSGWPTVEGADNGAYAAFEGDDPTADAGKNTVYLVQLPPDVGPGDLVRVHAHCLTHGEYVDFLTLPT